MVKEGQQPAERSDAAHGGPDNRQWQEEHPVQVGGGTAPLVAPETTILRRASAPAASAPQGDSPRLHDRVHPIRQARRTRGLVGAARCKGPLGLGPAGAQTGSRPPASRIRRWPPAAGPLTPARSRPEGQPGPLDTALL